MAQNTINSGSGGDFGGGGASNGADSQWVAAAKNTGGQTGSWDGAGSGTTNDTGAFAHRADNITVSKEMHSFNFQPNILNSYDVVTYHWKLYITSLPNSTSGDVLATQNQIMIAETGVTDLTIDKVELRGVAIPTVETGTGTQTHAKFEIVEPAGASMLDKMFYEAVSLGIGNWFVMPCYLQLEFRGRNPETESSDLTGAPGSIGNLKWVWPVKLTTVKANVTKVGTTYEFDAVMYNELAQSNSYFNMQHSVVLRELTTFGSAMADLEKKINADQLEKLIDNYSIPDTYRIIVDPKLISTNITPNNNTENTSRGADYVTFDKKTATYNPNTSVDKIIDSLLGNTDYYQEKLQGSKTPSAKPGTSNTVPDQMKKFWRIVTETHPIAFDPLRQDNAVEITIFIIQYDIGILDVNASQTGQTADTIDAAKKRAAEYVNKRILNKIYNYMFTGLNDQVISFDLNMNFSYAATMARFGGIYSNTATQTGEGIVNQNNAEEEKNITTQLRQTLQFVNDASPSDEGKSDRKITAMRDSIKNSKVLDDFTKNKYNILLDHAKPADRVSYVQSEQKLAADSVQNAKGLVSPNSALSPAFISDVNEKTSASQASLQTMQALGKSKMRPIPYREGAQETNLDFGIDQASSAGRNRASSIFTTALYTGLDSSLQHVKLHIKGDPYWLFPEPVTGEVTRLIYNSYIAKYSPATAIERIKYAHIYNNTAVNLFGTDNFIVIRFRTPKIHNDKTGEIEAFTEAEMFSGIYRVTEITSKFEKGTFTQEITCILDPVIDISNLRSFLNEIELTQGKIPVVSPAQAAAFDARTTFAKIDPRRADIKNTDRVNTIPGNSQGPALPPTTI